MTPEEKQDLYEYLDWLVDKRGMPQPWADSIRIKINTMPEESDTEALGFAFGYACNLLDKGIDPRKHEMSKVLENWLEQKE